MVSYLKKMLPYMGAVTLMLMLSVCSSGNARENAPQRPEVKDNFDFNVPSTREPDTRDIKEPADPDLDGPEEPDDESTYERPRGYNIQLCVTSNDRVAGSGDRRCYYRVFVDGREAGRTSIGLESRPKCFDFMVTPGKRQITLEKYILNESEGRYLKVNNIEQPRPSSLTVEVSSNRVIEIKVNHSIRGSAAEYDVRTRRR